jgi:hypothetical protein
MKYIVYDTPQGPISAIIFANHIEHSEMANLLRIARDDIYSAGFVRFDEANGVYCTGFSTTLGVGARDEDTAFIRNLLK